MVRCYWSTRHIAARLIASGLDALLYRVVAWRTAARQFTLKEQRLIALVSHLVVGDRGYGDDARHLGQAPLTQRLVLQLLQPACPPPCCVVQSAPRLGLPAPCVALAVALASL
jgi:hypothetical protein